MTIQYLDPYKDNLFGKLKGDKKDAYFKATFDECKLYKHEDSYVLAGYFTSFVGVDRAYGNDPINPGLCELPVYCSEYEIRQKKPGTGENGTKKEYETIKVQPSIAEKLLYQHIEDNPTQYLEEGKTYKGEVTFVPDDLMSNFKDNEQQLSQVVNNITFEAITPSGKHPDWTPPKPYNGKSSYGNKSITPQEKLAFLKEELAATVHEHTISSNKDLPIAAYIHKIIDENQDNERFLVCYFDLVKALVS